MIGGFQLACKWAERAAALAALLLAVALTPDSARGAITYPQIAVGGGYETVLTITNPSDQTWVGLLEFKTGNHADFPITLKANGQDIPSSSEWTVPAKSTVRYVIAGDQALRNGFLTLSRLSGPEEWELATSLFFRISDLFGRTTDLVGVQAVGASRDVIFPTDRSATSDTGIALLAPAGALDPITFTLVRSDGVTLEQVEKTIPGHTAMMASELFSELPATFFGAIKVGSTTPIHVLALRLEFGGDSVQLTGAVPVPFRPSAQAETRVLPFSITDAQYSRSLDRIIAVGRDPHRLHIYDPVTNSDDYVGLFAPPQCLSVSPDGTHAIVGHNSWLSYVNLTTRKVEKTLPINWTASDAVLADKFAYVLDRLEDQLVTVRLSNGEEITPYLSGDFVALHPSGQALYMSDNWSLYRADLVDGIPVLPVHETSDHSNFGGDMWCSEDGERVFLGEYGVVVRTSQVEVFDRQLNGSLGGRVTYVAHSQSAGRVAFLRGDQLNLVMYDGLQLTRPLYLPKFLPASDVTSSGKFLFYNASGTKLYVIVQADPSAGLSKDFGIVVLNSEELE
jgi:hypothetical protein